LLDKKDDYEYFKKGIIKTLNFKEKENNRNIINNDNHNYNEDIILSEKDWSINIKNDNKNNMNLTIPLNSSITVINDSKNLNVSVDTINYDLENRVKL